MLSEKDYYSQHHYRAVYTAYIVHGAKFSRRYIKLSTNNSRVYLKFRRRNVNAKISEKPPHTARVLFYLVKNVERACYVRSYHVYYREIDDVYSTNLPTDNLKKCLQKILRSQPNLVSSSDSHAKITRRHLFAGGSGLGTRLSQTAKN